MEEKGTSNSEHYGQTEQIKIEEFQIEVNMVKSETEENGMELDTENIKTEDTDIDIENMKTEDAECALFWEMKISASDDNCSGEDSFCTYDDHDTSEDLTYSDDEVADPSYENARQTSPPSSPEGPRERGRTRHKYRWLPHESTSRCRSPLRPGTTQLWNTGKKQDICPVVKRFVPARAVGHQLNPSTTYTPLDLFKLFISETTALTLCNNTNKQAEKQVSQGKKFLWTKLTSTEFFKYLGLTFYFALVRLPYVPQYWKKQTIFSQTFPPTVMTRDRYQTISWNLHMSDPDKDRENDSKKGTSEYDNLFRVKPLMDDIQVACRTYYHPKQNISINERMGATKSRTGITKPNKWGFKLFVLGDTSNGYTLDFNVCTGKWGVVAYDSVMTLLKRTNPGNGYILYTDNYYTSPKLFRNLYHMNIGACGIYKDNRRGCPRTTKNALKNTDPRGTIRWIRDDPIVFVKWMDNREVSMCSTVHQAYSGHTTQRKVRGQDLCWSTISVPCPTPVVEYNKHMGGVDLFDQLIQYYTVHHRASWYKTLFLHFIDIAATNSYLLHKELCKENLQQPMTYRIFLEELTAQLCGVTVDIPSPRAQSDHVPVPTSQQTEASKRASYGRKSCVHCRHTRKVTQSTPWKCKACDVALCLVPNRNCFEKWHE